MRSVVLPLPDRASLSCAGVFYLYLCSYDTRATKSFEGPRTRPEEVSLTLRTALTK